VRFPLKPECRKGRPGCVQTAQRSWRGEETRRDGYCRYPSGPGLEKKGLEVVDGQQVMLEARMIKTKDEIELLKTAAAMVDAAYESIARAIRPGARENDLVAVANQVLYSLGSELVDA